MAISKSSADNVVVPVAKHDPLSVFDLLILTDATSSMGSYLNALNHSLQEIISVSALTACFERIGLLAYRDYCGGELTEWSGWCSPSDETALSENAVTQDSVLKMAQNVRPQYGGDWPEATKTGLAHAYKVMREEATTIILLYTDAPPHSAHRGGKNLHSEQETLTKKGTYGKDSHLFADWTSAAKTMGSGSKKAIIFSIVQESSADTWSPYLYLSTITGGNLLIPSSTTSSTISQLTLSLLLTWMGQEQSSDLTNDAKLGQLIAYKSVGNIEAAQQEGNDLATFVTQNGYGPMARDVEGNTKKSDITLSSIAKCITTRGPLPVDLARRYASDEKYRRLTINQLRRIIETNVVAITVNPIFGSLWRALCNDRANQDRDGLLQLFSVEVNKIADANQKTKMKTWLEESYNFVREIEDLIETIPRSKQYPQLFLDPTSDFSQPRNLDGEGDDRPLNEFTRVELLEIGRSCDYKILRRLGKVLTRLTYVRSEDQVPEHIKATNDIPRIPMALTEQQHGRHFWKVLLHAVLPGTKISARPAAVLAALALRMGIVPLRESADRELLAYRELWNNLEVPETWNLGCLGLLLEADKDFESRVDAGVATRTELEARVLNEKDRGIFRKLVEYKMLELNLQTVLNAKISWQPEKNKVSIGPVVMCKDCKFPRSVTAMSTGGRCGHCEVLRTDCSCDACTQSEDFDQRRCNNVNKNDDEHTTGYWVECNKSSCRGQYVIYNPDKLRVRPKCFYCRHDNIPKERSESKVHAAPLVECTRCLSRIIWPEEYRHGLNLKDFQCPACTSAVVTIIHKETTAQELSKENGTSWLLNVKDKALSEPFSGRSLFYTASHCNLGTIASNVEVLPGTDEAQLTIHGKSVQNYPEMQKSLRGWIESRKAEAGECSLCFSNVRKSELRQSACGRSGCKQPICQSCLQSWYGINAPGRIINVAAVNCPFCRRKPAASTVRPFRLDTCGDLRKAVDESGIWIYAWCLACGFAKEHIERVCAAGPPPALAGWVCEGCRPAVQGGSKENELGKIKMCPECGVATEKTSGCDHISCPCGAHWCYVCGTASGEADIYDHIQDEHGGLWGDDDDMLEDEEWID